MPKTAPLTRRQGQRQGQIAALVKRHGVPARWLRLIAFGSLEDPAFVQAIREAARTPALWDLVAPSALDALTIPLMKTKRLGRSRDDLLGLLLESLEVLRAPINQNFARQTSLLEYVNQSLDLRLEEQLEAEADRGRRSLTSTHVAADAKAASAAARALAWKAEVEARQSGVPKSTLLAKIGRRDNVTTDAVRKAIDYQKKLLRKK